MSAETWLGWHQLALGLAVVALVVLAAWARSLAEELAEERLRRWRLEDELAQERYEHALPPGRIDGRLRLTNEGGIRHGGGDD